ncbi:restriction endonuclease subunit S [Thalassotalea piscium]|uniref:Type I restriction enzyme S subunit n=1 Tax=Thalassotalea piscium TaxID=1230533 RepID=A0A7X0TSQ9_9GAMM|nr:restriction endonuclease subunit S [Thalassotalea piscium]MBB6542398.1 type I restriction enzyme S subunit [Thalassotalea piscium]
MPEIATMPKYGAYKDSGFEWIGEVPDSWELTKLGSCLFPVSIKNCPDLPLLSITRELGVIERDIENQDSNHNFIPDDLSGYKKLEKGQFGMNKMKAWQGSYGVSQYTGIVSPAYFVFNFTKSINPEFFNWAIRSKLYVSYFGSASDGVRVGQWDLSKERMKAIPFILPSEKEQTAIANFLDKKTAQINEAIAIKEKQIKLLKERKQIIIQQAVTQGLNSDAPMKDSGVDWIGKIPEHWQVKRLKYVLDERNERSKTGEEPLFMMSQIHGLVVRADYHAKAEVAASNVDNKIVYKNDLVFNKLKAHLGVFFKSNIDFKGLVSPDYAVYKPKAYITDMRYLEVLFRHPRYIEQFIIRATGIVEGLIRLYTDDLFDIAVPIAPKDEQIEILKHIDSESEKFDIAIKLQIQQIEKLKEYKTTLINSAVTGKIKVPEVDSVIN